MVGRALAEERNDEWRADHRVTLLNYSSTINEAAHQLMVSAGYEIAKVFRRMRIDLRIAHNKWSCRRDTRSGRSSSSETNANSSMPCRPHLPNTGRLPRELSSIGRRPGWRRGSTPICSCKLLHEDVVVGVCCGKPVGDGGWIGYVAVIPEFRRRGLAKLLLQESVGRFWDKGIKQVDLGVDSGNGQSAIDLYLGMGVHESHSYETNRKGSARGCRLAG